MLITITLPEGVTIKGLETDVPNTLQKVRCLPSKVNFDKLTLQGSNSPIIVEVSPLDFIACLSVTNVFICQAVSANIGSLTTSNGEIRGSFYTTTCLFLTTSNSPIIADVALHSDSTEPILRAQTSNG